MFSYIRLACLATFIAIALTPSITEAGVQYGFHFDQSQYFVAAGSTVNVKVYLRESFDPGDTTLLDTEGLFGGGVRVFFNEAPIPSVPAEVLTLADIIPNGGFDDTVTLKDLVVGTSAGFTSNVGTSPLPVGADVGATFHQVLLGSFTFTAGLNPGEITHLRATDFDVSLDDFVTNNSLTVLDSLIRDSTATIVVDGVQAVPEPSSILIIAATCMTFLCYRRTRKK